MEEIIKSELFRNALLGGSLTAILCAAVGYFMVLRTLAFASEALTDIGFAGATGSVLLGWNPFWGMIGLSFLAVVALGTLNTNNKLKGRDVDVGMVLSFALGLGVLFLSLYAKSSASHASSGVRILFGSLMSLTGPVLRLLIIVAIAVLLVLVLIFRPLLFASVDPNCARAKGVPTKALDYVYLVLLAATTAVSIQAIGVLLAFSLISAPAGAAQKLTRNPALALLVAVLLGLGITWSGILLSFLGPWKKIPLGFYITSFSALIYGLALIRDQLRTRSKLEAPHHHEREINAV
jgi:zinc/manganese transport system permease protein